MCEEGACMTVFESVALRWVMCGDVVDMSLTEPQIVIGRRRRR